MMSTVLDKTCMFTVFTERDNKPWTHSVKALQIIWNHFPQLWVPADPSPPTLWHHFHASNAKNTVHVDDLVRNYLPVVLNLHWHYQSRNFALNPKEGLKIAAFKNAHTMEAAADRELPRLTHYLLHIANCEDFTTLAHKVSHLELVCMIWSLQYLLFF